MGRKPGRVRANKSHMVEGVIGVLTGKPYSMLIKMKSHTSYLTNGAFKLLYLLILGN